MKPFRMILFFSLSFVLSGLLPRPAQAQTELEKRLASFFDIGGYFFTSNKTVKALGSPEFYSEGSYFGPPATFGPVGLSGGVQLISGSDHFFPFTSSSNGFSLIGPALRLATKRHLDRLQYELTAGVYAVNINSNHVGINTTIISPSMEVTVNYPFARYFTLQGGYRLAPSVDGLDTSGFILALHFF